MKAIYTSFFLCVTVFLSAQDFAQTITTQNFEQDGSELVIYFQIPANDNVAYSYNLHSAHIYDRDQNKVDIETMDGAKHDLKEGKTYEVRWNVLEDVDELYAPRKVQLNLEYTEHAKAVAAKQAAQLAEIKRKQERKSKKPFSVGLMAYGGYVHGLLGDADSDITSEFGYGLGAGIFVEKRVGDGWYLQLEGAYQQRKFIFTNTGSNVEYNYNVELYYDTKKARVDFRDYRIYARLKFKNFFYIGGYYAWFQKAERSGEQNLEVVVPDNPSQNQTIQEPDLRYSFLDNQQFPADEFGNRPIQNDYGVTLGVETPSFRNIVFSLGYDISLGNILNDNYWRNRPTDNTDFYPTTDTRLRLGYLYARFGLRL